MGRFVSGRRGINRFGFDGRISRTNQLKPGHYLVQVTAIALSGRRSIPLWVSFRQK